MSEPARHRLLFWAVVASQFAPPFMFSGVAVALPDFDADLGAGAIALGLVETTFLGGSLAFLLPAGRLADATDKRAVYKLGLLASGLISALAGVSSSVPLILALRFLQGVASASLAVAGPAILADIVAPERRGRAFGAALAAIYGGLTLGPICAGVLVETWSWRAVFLAGGAALLAAHLLIHWLLPSRWRKPDEPVPLGSTALVVSAVLCLVGGSALLREGAAGVALLALGLTLAAAFVLVQRRVERPLLDTRALGGNRVLRNALLVQLLLYTNAFCSIFLLSLFMQATLGHSAQTAGRVIAVGTALMAGVAPAAGTLADRFRPWTISNAGVVCVLATAVLARTLDESASLVLVGAVLCVQGLGFALFATPNMTVIMNSVAEDEVGMASALGAKARSIGMVCGMLITSLLIALHIGSDPIERHPAELVRTTRDAFTILALSSTVALVVSILTRAPPRRRAPAPEA